MLTAFGRFCRKLRIDNGELMKNMASRLGVTVAYLSAVEIGKRAVPEAWLEKIEESYNLSKQEVQEMKKAFEESVDFVKLSLKNQSPAHREAAMTFARKFDELNEDEIKILLEAFKKANDKKQGE